MTEEKIEVIKKQLLEVFSKNKCTVAEAKLILEFFVHDIESNATVRVDD